MHSKMVKTSPLVYVGFAGQILDPLTHSDPYQNAKANIPKKHIQEKKCIHESVFTWFYNF